jgi:hypothetical protein
MYPEITEENIKKYFETFLEFWALDFNNSSKLWDLYLNFEKKNFENYKSSNDQENIIKTTYHIRSIYRRRLSFPHIDLDIIWNEYISWESVQEERKKVEEKYRKVIMSN